MSGYIAKYCWNQKRSSTDKNITANLIERIESQEEESGGTNLELVLIEIQNPIGWYMDRGGRPGLVGGRPRGVGGTLSGFFCGRWGGRCDLS
jgi:hypothetical protein